MSRQRKILSIKRLPPKIERLSDREFIAWVRGATGLSQQEALQNPRLARDRLLAALKKERAAARRKRKA